MAWMPKIEIMDMVPVTDIIPVIPIDTGSGGNTELTVDIFKIPTDTDTTNPPIEFKPVLIPSIIIEVIGEDGTVFNITLADDGKIPATTETKPEEKPTTDQSTQDSPPREDLNNTQTSDSPTEKPTTNSTTPESSGTNGDKVNAGEVLANFIASFADGKAILSVKMVSAGLLATYCTIISI